jgi:PadR family transcriptional regulator, regulatory protein PadR
MSFMGRNPVDYLHGTLETLILKTLTGGPMHGYAIAKWIEDATDEALAVEEGSLYPALYRMEKKGWLDAEWGTSELGRRAKFYRLTRAGRQQLASDTAAWTAFATAVSRVLIPAFAHAGSGELRRGLAGAPSGRAGGKG